MAERYFGYWNGREYRKIGTFPFRSSSGEESEVVIVEDRRQRKRIAVPSNDLIKVEPGWRYYFTRDPRKQPPELLGDDLVDDEVPERKITLYRAISFRRKTVEASLLLQPTGIPYLVRLRGDECEVVT